MTIAQIIIISIPVIGYMYSLWCIVPEEPTRKQWNMYPLNMLCFFLIVVTVILLSITNNKHKDLCPQYEKVQIELYKIK